MHGNTSTRISKVRRVESRQMLHKSQTVPMECVISGPAWNPFSIRCIQFAVGHAERSVFLSYAKQPVKDLICLTRLTNIVNGFRYESCMDCIMYNLLGEIFNSELVSNQENALEKLSLGSQMMEDDVIPQKLLWLLHGMARMGVKLLQCFASSICASGWVIRMHYCLQSQVDDWSAWIKG